MAAASHPTAASPGSGDTRLTFVSPGCEVGMLPAESCVVLLTSVPQSMTSYHWEETFGQVIERGA